MSFGSGSTRVGHHAPHPALPPNLMSQPNDRFDRSFAASFLILSACGVLACGPSKASQAVHVPGEDASIDDYEDMLGRAEAALSDIGLEKSAAPGGGAPSAGADAADSTAAEAAAPAEAGAEAEQTKSSSGFNGDCDTLCDLSSTTCELEARICVLAARHAGDARYESACSRAGDDCELAEGTAESSCECEY